MRRQRHQLQRTACYFGGTIVGVGRSCVELCYPSDAALHVRTVLLLQTLLQSEVAGQALLSCPPRRSLQHCRFCTACPQHAAGAGELEEAALKEGEYVAVRRFVRLLERGGDAKVASLPPSATKSIMKQCTAPALVKEIEGCDPEGIRVLLDEHPLRL